LVSQLRIASSGHHHVECCSSAVAATLTHLTLYILPPTLARNQLSSAAPPACLLNYQRSFPVWHLMGDYLSARLVKTAELDPQGRYLFAAYPHGISAISGWVCFATEAAGFSRLFPGEQQH
jgi:hypothetical protein